MAHKKYYDLASKEWVSAVEDIEKRMYTKDEAKDLFKQGKIKAGEIFTVKGASTQHGPVWMAATFVGHVFTFTRFQTSASDLETKKRKGVAHLMEIIERGWIDTRQAPWLPPKLQNAENPDLVLYGVKSTDTIRTTLGSNGLKKILAEDEAIDLIKDITPDVF